MSEDPRTFEELMSALEAVTERLAAGDLGIEAAADLYAEAERLHALASDRLAQVQARVEALPAPEGQVDPTRLSGRPPVGLRAGPSPVGSPAPDHPVRPLQGPAAIGEPPGAPPAPDAGHGPPGRLGPGDGRVGSPPGTRPDGSRPRRRRSPPTGPGSPWCCPPRRRSAPDLVAAVPVGVAGERAGWPGWRRPARSTSRAESRHTMEGG